jgi:hypothetical protein
MKTTLVENRWLILILILFLALGIWYSITVPLGESPDESEHFLYTQYIVLEHSLPVMSPVYEQNFTVEAHQPPLYYLIGAVLTGWIEMDPAHNLIPNNCFSFEPDDPGRQNAFFHNREEWLPREGVYLAFRLLRWFSIFIGAATIVIAYKIGRQIYPSRSSIGLTAAAALAFNPQFIFITASVNNDVLASFLGATSMMLCVMAVRNLKARYYLFLGLVIGLGILAKLSVLAFWPLAILAAVVPMFYFEDSSVGRVERSSKITGPSKLASYLSNFRIDVNLKHLVINGSLVIGVPLLVAGWWYGRSFILHGDPFMWEVSLQAKQAIIARSGPFTFADLLEFIPLHFQSYWAWFGWLNVNAPDWLFIFFAFLVIASLVGLARLILSNRLEIDWIALAFNVLGIIAIYASLFRYIQTVNWTGYQGRLAFTAAASIAVVLALGWYSLGGIRLGAALNGGLFLAAVAIVPTILLPAYPRPEIYKPTSDFTRTCARFESGIQVEAIDIPSNLKPGEIVQAKVFGLGLSDSAKPQSLDLQLRGRDGLIVGKGSTLINWAAGEVISETVAIQVDEQAEPAKASLEIGIRNTNGYWQSATSATGRILDTPLASESVKIGPVQLFEPDPQYSTSYTLDGKLALLGYDVNESGDQLTMTLYWEALNEISQDYTTFIHLLDEDGNLINQHDSQPQDGMYPTSIWDVGEVVADMKILQLEDDKDLHELNLAIGVYNLETLERLPVFDIQSFDNSKLQKDGSPARSYPRFVLSRENICQLK